MRALFSIPLAVLLAAFVSANAQTPDYAKLSNVQLINQLAHVDGFAPGLHPNAGTSGFIAEDTRFGFQGGVLGSVPPKIDPAMREFVRRGAAALPTLIANLGNATPTKLFIHFSHSPPQADDPPSYIPIIFTWGEFSMEYDPKALNSGFMTPGGQKHIASSYTVKVGDVCYVLIGQIVNRHLEAMHYQPSGGVIFNSPIEMPVLIDWVKADWDGTDANALRDSLVSDAHSPDSPTGGYWRSALVRLRFYYPADYQKLKSGDLHDRIVEFEKSEAPPPPSAPASGSQNRK